MSDNYGIKTSKKGINAITATGSDIIMTTRFPFAKIDQTKLDTFRTTTITFLRDPTPNVTTVITSFAHGYNYTPQVWGLWDINWSGALGGFEANGYGSVSNSTGVPSSTFDYTVDETNVYIRFKLGHTGFSTPSATGTTATLTTYIFVDDLQEATYT
jgi:hypothetical protein